jgi:hypothetical protein
MQVLFRTGRLANPAVHFNALMQVSFRIGKPVHTACATAAPGMPVLFRAGRLAYPACVAPCVQVLLRAGKLAYTACAIATPGMQVLFRAGKLAYPVCAIAEPCIAD